MADAAKQSTFVTVVAWLVIIFSGMSALAGLMQSVMVATVDIFPTVPPEEAKEMPPFMVFAFNNFRALVFGMTALYVVSFAGAIGAVRRREWGRQVLIAVFSIAAAGMAAMAVIMELMMNEVFRGATEVPPDARAMMTTFRIFSVIFAVVFVAAFGWLAYKFSTPAIRAEFR